MLRSIMICAVIGMVGGFTVTAGAQVGRDGLADRPHARRGAAPAAAGACAPQQIQYKTSAVSVNTTSNVFAEVPQTTINFDQGGSSASCVIVRYSAMGAAAYPRWIQMRVVMDGNVVAQPGNIQFEGHTQSISLARSFDFIFPAVDPGPHSVVVQWRSFNTGIVHMHRRTTLVQHQ